MSVNDLAAASAAFEQANAAAAEENVQTVVGHVLWTPEMVKYIAVALLLFTFLVLVMVTFLLYKKDQWGLQTLRTFGIILIISFSSVLLVVGYSNEQLTPIVGLFGAIAGYLLGHTNAPAPAAGGGGVTAFSVPNTSGAAASASRAAAADVATAAPSRFPATLPRMPANPEI